MVWTNQNSKFLADWKQGKMHVSISQGWFCIFFWLFEKVEQVFDADDLAD